MSSFRVVTGETRVPPAPSARGVAVTARRSRRRHRLMPRAALHPRPLSLSYYLTSQSRNHDHGAARHDTPRSPCRVATGETRVPPATSARGGRGGCSAPSPPAQSPDADCHVMTSNSLDRSVTIYHFCHFPSRWMWGGKGVRSRGRRPHCLPPVARSAAAVRELGYSAECRHHCCCHFQPLSSTSLIPLVPNRIYPCVPAGRRLPATNDGCLRQSGVRTCHPLGSQRRSIDAPNALSSLDTKTNCVRPGPYSRPLPVPGIPGGEPPGCGTSSTCSPNFESSLPTMLS